MKRFLITSILAAMVAVGTALMAQDYPDEYLGLPGDNLNLYAVMNLFQESETIEGFERSLNDENSRINNLDLNNDNYIDYIKVIDYVDGNAHTIVLQAVLDRNESQDLAVFTVQRFRDGSVQIQLIGDEALYGRNYIVEPIYAETPNPGYTGRSNTVVRTTYVEVAAWPLVRFIYLPDYRIWHSSWYWGYYPSYWHPWRPYYWHYYYGYHYHWYPHYYARYHHWDRPRWDRWNDFYYRDKRIYSRNVTININAGRYRNTYSRPEMRQEGETLYAKVHPERASNMSSGSNNGRRSASEVSPSRQSTGTVNGTTRRSTSTVESNTRTNASQGQSTGTVRRSSATVNENRAANPSSGQNTGTVRRSTTTVNENRAANPSSGQSAGTVRRSTTTVNESRAANPSSGQNAGTARRSTTTVNERASTNTSAGQNNSAVSRPAPTVTSRSGSSSTAGSSSGSARRSSETVSSRTSSKSQSVQRAETSRSSRQPAASSGSSSRKSGGSSKSESASKKSSAGKESESSSSRRK
jgi:hypothetical protein